MLPLLHIFGLTIQTPLLAIIIGYMAGLMIASRVATDRGLDGNAISDIGFYGLLIGVVAARIGFVILNVQAYAREPLSALMPTTTAMLPIAGWLAGGVYAVFTLGCKRMLQPALLDALTPGVIIFLAGLALGALLNGDAFGAVAELPWSIYLWDAWRHPVQVYEIIALLAILGAVLFTLVRRIPQGVTFVLAIGLYSFARVIIDGFRAESDLVAGIRISQLVGVICSVVSFWIVSELVRERKEAVNTPIQTGVTK